MVKAIQVFKYEYAPSKADIRQKLPNKKIIRRPIAKMYKENNVRKIDHLETIIKDLDENNEDGILGFIQHQYFRKLTLANDEYTYEDLWQNFFFFVSSKYNIVIMGGGPEKLRNEARDILVQLLSGDISFISVISVKTKKMFSLVNKIKKEGPVIRAVAHPEKGEYKNIMTDTTWYFIRINDHGGEKREENNMHRNENDPRCVSKHDSFQKNLDDSDSFEPTIALYKCNGILDDEVTKAHHLTMYDDARYECTSDPDPKHWIIFVTQTCKNALGID